MSHHNDPRYLAAQERYTAAMADDETPDSRFARRVLAAYEMWLIETGQPVPEQIDLADALGTYGSLAGADELERALS